MKKLQSEGHEVKLLDDEPTITIYEQIILQASFACEGVTDIKSYAEMYNLPDCPEFLELVLFARKHHAKN